MTSHPATPPAGAPERAPLPPSPCVGICTLKGEHCYGCGRTSDEIAAWGGLSVDEQSAVWAELPTRLAAFGFKTFRLAAGPGVVAQFMARTFRETSGRWRIVSSSVEAGFRVNSIARPELTETGAGINAIAGDGDRLHLIKHDRVRIFGFASRDDVIQMDTVALVLPKGRAQRDLDAVCSPTGPYMAGLVAPAPFSGAALRLDNQAASANISAMPWADARDQIRYHCSAGTGRFILRNALGSIETTSPRFAELPPAPEANAPVDLKISKAFVAGAVFHADDPQWLAAALAP